MLNKMLNKMLKKIKILNKIINNIKIHIIYKYQYKIIEYSNNLIFGNNQ